MPKEAEACLDASYQTQKAVADGLSAHPSCGYTPHSLFHPLHEQTWVFMHALSSINHGWLGLINDLTWLCNYNGHYIGCRLVIILHVGYQWQLIQAATIKTLKDVYNFLPVILGKCGPHRTSHVFHFPQYFVRPIESSKLPWIVFMIKHPNSETTLVYSVIYLNKWNKRRAIFDLSRWGKMPFFGK